MVYGTIPSKATFTRVTEIVLPKTTDQKPFLLKLIRMSQLFGQFLKILGYI